MKPSKFDYQLPATLTECLEFLATDTEDVAIIAGGQSLVPLLNLRMAKPDRVVDINNIPELREFRREKDTLLVGAMVRHNTVQTHEFFRTNLPLMSEAMESVAHVQIKTRGTLGGNLCNAHPASEMPAVMLALGARLRCRSKKAGDRIIPIEEFFVGSMDNALNNDEILCEIQIQAPSANTGWAFQELARRHGDFAQCGAAVLIGVEDGKINYARIGLCSVAATPIRFNALEEWLIGMEIGENLVEEVSRFSAENLTVEDDPNMSTGNKVTLASTLIARTVARATDRVSQVNLKKG